MKHFVCFLLGLVVIFIGVSEVTAVPITIKNTGFEAPILADGKWTNSIPDWITFNDGVGPGGGVGVFNPTTAHFAGEAPEGFNTAFSNGNGFYQFLSDSLTPGTYTLQVEVGDRLDTGFPGYGVRLQANTIILAQDLSTLSPISGFKTSVVTFTADISNPNLGQPLVIALTNPGGAQVNFDNVRLDFAAAAHTPEPSTLILFGVGALGFIGYGWQRYKQNRQEKT